MNWYKKAQSEETQINPWDKTREEWMEYVKSRRGYKGLPEKTDPSGIYHYPLLKGRHNVALTSTDKHQFGQDSYNMEVSSPRTPSVKETAEYRSWDKEKKNPKYKTYDSEIVDENGTIVDERYKTPAEVFDKKRVPSENYMYRGMSAPELRSIVTNGYIQSDAHLNFNDQQDVTCFADNADQSFSYAGGFAPWYEAPSYEEPSYVIEVKKSPLAKKNSVGEIEVPGKVPISEIVRVFEVRVAEEHAGQFDLRPDYPNMETGVSKLREGSSFGLSQQYLIRELPREEWGESYYDRAMRKKNELV